jgi:hypothetical protein
LSISIEAPPSYQAGGIYIGGNLSMDALRKKQKEKSEKTA